MTPADPAERLPDQEARDRIVADLDTSLLVEAGAGSGKTRALVERMVALVRERDVRPDQIAAVTFTRKAASELRERFQSYLEGALVAAATEGERSRLDRALREVDRAFIGTIHSFCARLLRERPLEARLDPAFRETLEDEEARRASAFWVAHLERTAAAGGPTLEALYRVGLRPDRLRDLFFDISGNPDVDFEPEPAPPPDPAEVDAVRAEVDRVLDRFQQLVPDPLPEKPDPVQRRLNRLAFLRRIVQWRKERDFLEALAPAVGKKYSCTYVRWGDDDVKARVKRLEEACEGLFGEDGPAYRLMERWWAHRYPVAIRFAREAAEAYAEHRRRAGWLNFNDLLSLSADLLRRSPDARRELGERYRYLLVDEFQDTDPIQAEVVLLLASPPEEGTRWRDVEPRPGQLFVVGDPKQSIYRFRRADISVYQAVRERFGVFGDVLPLEANFRSVHEVGDLVGGVFPGEAMFPREGSPYQARFAPLLTRTREEEPVERGIFHYAVSPDGRGKTVVFEDDAARLARWIAERVQGASADRRPGDFLVLTWGRRELATYVEAMEAFGLPVEVSGADVSTEEELREVITLLRALVDPDDPVLVVSVLVGIFFGLDLAQLRAHREHGGRFDPRLPARPGEEGDPEVVEALERLGRWWRRASEVPSDVLMGEIVDALGLVPYAAAGELGALRAGALLYALDAIRVAALEGDASLLGALDALEAALDAREADLSLEAGRAQAVRVMNLHRAKGLEAPVVVLAAPVPPYDPDPVMHVARTDEDEARGWLVVQQKEGYQTRILARPLEWSEYQAEEARHGAAEVVRLLYVAATRARDELIVARHPAKDGRSVWAPLHPWLDEHASELDLPAEPPPARERLERTGAEMRSAEQEARARRRALARPTYHFRSVTELVKGPGAGRYRPAEATGRSEDPEGPDAEPQIDLFTAASPPEATMDAVGSAESGGAEAVAEGEGSTLHQGADWGSAVHAALEAAARGAEGPHLRSVARAHLLEYERPLDDEGEPVELEALLETVAAVRRSGLWTRALEAERRLSEVPFALRDAEAREEVPVFVDGQVDLAFLERDGWVLVDYKTDVDPEPSRMERYRAQLRAYADAWEGATGEPVAERLILLTRRGEVHRV